MLSSSFFVIGIVIFTTLIVTGIIEIAMPILKSKFSNVDIEKSIKNVGDIVNQTETLASAVTSIVPVDNKTSEVLFTIESWSKKAVEASEQLYKASQLKPEDRKEKAKEMVYAALSLMNIEKTSEVDKIIDGSIESEVYALKNK